MLTYTRYLRWTRRCCHDALTFLCSRRRSFSLFFSPLFNATVRYYEWARREGYRTSFYSITSTEHRLREVYTLSRWAVWKIPKIDAKLSSYNVLFLLCIIGIEFPFSQTTRPICDANFRYYLYDTLTKRDDDATFVHSAHCVSSVYYEENKVRVIHAYEII